MNQYYDKDMALVNLTFEYQYPTNWLLINVAFHKSGGVATISGFHVRQMPDSLENYHRFTFAGKNILQLAVYILAWLIPLFSIYALVICIRTRIARRKWLWIIFILLGIGKFTVNWKTGQWQLNFLQVQLLGSSVIGTPYGPWLFAVSVPLGAIIFLRRGKNLNPVIPVPPKIEG